MKKEKVYRYSLQFPGKTEEQVRVGELLEQLGSRKSRFLIRAVSDFIDSHPEEVAMYTFARSLPAPTPTYSREELRSLLIELLAEHGFTEKTPSFHESPPAAEPSGDTDVNVDDMLSNLDIFLQQS
jgi:hypothetical protein